MRSHLRDWLKGALSVATLLTFSPGVPAQSQTQQKTVELLVGQSSVQLDQRYIKAKPSEAANFEGQAICADGVVESILGSPSGGMRIVVADAMTGPRLEAVVSDKVAEIIDEGDKVKICGFPSRKPDSNRVAISNVEVLQRLDRAEWRSGPSATVWQTYVSGDRRFQILYPLQFQHIEVNAAEQTIFIGENKYLALGVEIRQFPGTCPASLISPAGAERAESESKRIRVEKSLVNGREHQIEIWTNGRLLLDFIVQVQAPAHCFQIKGTAPIKSKVDQRLVMQTVRSFAVVAK